MAINKICFYFGLLLMISSNIALAKDIKAKGDVTFESGMFSSEPDARIKQQAVDAAVVNAWKRYTSEFTMAKLNTYKQSQSYFETNLNEFIVDKRILDESLDNNTNTYSVVVSVSFNDVAIESKLNEGNDKSGYLDVAGGKSRFGFLFVAREQASVNEFDNRRTDKIVETVEDEKTESAGFSGSGGHKKQTEELTRKRVTGGSTLHKAEDIKYRVFSSSAVNDAVSEVLVSNNFAVSDFADVTTLCHGPSMDQIKKEFAHNDELSGELRLEVLRVTKACDVSLRYYAIGTLNVEVTDIDPVTGNKRASVNFGCQVYDITSGLPTKAASVGPKHFYGLGPSDTSAITEALKVAATEGAKDIVNQLNAKKIK